MRGWWWDLVMVFMVIWLFPVFPGPQKNACACVLRPWLCACWPITVTAGFVLDVQSQCGGGGCEPYEAGGTSLFSWVCCGTACVLGGWVCCEAIHVLGGLWW